MSDGLNDEILAMMSPEQLRELLPEEIDWRLSTASIRLIFEACDAMWLHDGDPSKPHAKLTSGKCSNGFINTLQVLSYTNLCQIMAGQIFRELRERHDGAIDWVVGSDHASATLSYQLAALLGCRHDFTEKEVDRATGEKTQVWKRFQIKPGEVVLQVEELVTTAKTLLQVREALRAGNDEPVDFAPLALTLVHRSECVEIEGDPIRYGGHWDIHTWDQSECPLCKEGSKPLKPKHNWVELTA